MKCIYLDEGKRIYVDASMRAWPCCYLHYEAENLGSDGKDIKKIYDKYGEGFNDLNRIGLEDITNHEWFDHTLEDSFNANHPLNLQTCNKICGEEKLDTITEVYEKEYVSDNGKDSAVIRLTNNTTIGIFLSGGADSAILLYLLVKQIMESSLNVKIQPITWQRPYGKPLKQDWNVPVAQGVIDSVSLLIEDSEDVVLERYIFKPRETESPMTPQEEGDEWNRAIHIAKTELNVDYMIYGTTSNPDNDAMEGHDMMHGREAHRDKEFKEKHKEHLHSNPFMCVDKKFLRDMYAQNDLLNTLFPITRSCEGFSDTTNDFTTACGFCWWCKERKWAFGVY